MDDIRNDTTGRFGRGSLIMDSEMETIWNTWANHAFQTSIILQTPDVCKLSSGNPCSACLELEAFDTSDADGSLYDVEELVEKRRSLVKKINDRHDPLAYYLPFELSSIIFMFYYDNTGYASSVQSLENALAHTSTPRPLAAVCATWRQIALNIPLLWSSLRILYFNPKRYIEPNYLVQWLSRAGTRPLSIRMGFSKYNKYTKLTRGAIASLFDIIRGYSGRLKVLNLYIPSKLWKTFLGHQPLDTPLLETLELKIVGKVEGFSDSPIIALKTPRLYTLAISQVRLAMVEIQWASLTSVSVTALSVDEIFEIIIRAPSLLECSLEEIFKLDDSSTFSIHAIPVHTSLKTLKISPQDCILHHHDPMPTFFERVTLSSLRQFIYNFNHFIRPLPLRNFLAFLTRSGRELTHLSLESITIQSMAVSSFVVILELLPALIELCLSCFDMKIWTLVPTVLFERLAAFSLSNRPGSLHRDGFLANLQTLSYRGLRPNATGWEEMVPALENLACVLEKPNLIPLHTVRLTLSKLRRKFRYNLKNLPSLNTVMHKLLVIKKGGISLDIIETVEGEDYRPRPIDLLALYEDGIQNFSEFNDFPSHWFDTA